mgnify:FL=1|tara:strand:- start:1168 stop:1503 length:336 start_codon:yes stop_codon:yes gene_type:complete
MVKVIFKTTDGKLEEVNAPEGWSVMEASKQYSKNGYVDGIEGDCGGGAVCATCHVHVPTEWIDKTGKADSDGVELSVLEYEENFDENKSRLSCQIELDDKLDGLIVEIPHK